MADTPALTHPPTKIPANRVVVVMPNWLGDGVMATPFLRVLRRLYPAAHIAAAARPLVAPVCEGLVDHTETFEKRQEKMAVRWLREQRFDLGILLPNSFRSAWTLWRGRVKRRLGYARGGRSFLLTDRLATLRKTPERLAQDESIRVAIGLLRHEEAIADGDLMRVEVTGRFPRLLGLQWSRVRAFAEHRMRSDGRLVRTRVDQRSDDGLAHNVLRADFQPVAAVEYYLQLAQGLVDSPRSGESVFPHADRHMHLCISNEDRREAAAALAELNLIVPDGKDASTLENLALLVPGANFGSSKCWMPERFAAVAEQLADPAGPYRARVLLAGSPAETPICRAITAAMRSQQDRVHILGSVNGGKGVSIGALKEIVRQCRVMVCNDTGPRHIAAALGVPVVTLFGPTDPVWAETFFEKERIVRVEVPCGPCQLKTCPIDHRCMKGITVEQVMAAVGEVWGEQKAPLGPS